jgi:hypothetical protein
VPWVQPRQHLALQSHDHASTITSISAALFRSTPTLGCDDVVLVEQLQPYSHQIRVRPHVRHLNLGIRASPKFRVGLFGLFKFRIS